MDIVRYSEALFDSWNSFVSSSRNGTFLHDRRYMDYHSDRFTDHSLLFFDDGKLLALLPANETDGEMWSHQGLTYGGLLTSHRCTALRVMMIFEELERYLRERHIRRFVYKAIPHIYHRTPSEEDLYALTTVCRARLLQRDLSSALCPSSPLRWRRDRHYGASKALRDGIVVEESKDFATFWPILTDNLERSHGVRPVHTLEEMVLLHSRFPDAIRLYMAFRSDGVPLGGTVLYVTPRVVHAQYISATAEGKRLHAIDALYERILRHDFSDHAYFDFGKSTERDGTVLNASLLYQKEGFGARAVCYDWWEWVIIP